MYSLKAVLTVEYGKELRASLEVGDALYPYDNLVKVGFSNYGGVLVLYSSLTYEDIVKILRNTSLTYVKRIAKVDKCCPETLGELIICINDYLKQNNQKVGKVKIFERGKIKRYVNELVNGIRDMMDVDSNIKLYVIPIDYRICLSVQET
ncbi:MAG: hypothetical protein QXD94_06160 [Sulfolobales archaeon]